MVLETFFKNRRGWVDILFLIQLYTTIHLYTFLYFLKNKEKE